MKQTLAQAVDVALAEQQRQQYAEQARRTALALTRWHEISMASHDADFWEALGLCLDDYIVDDDALVWRGKAIKLLDEIIFFKLVARISVDASILYARRWTTVGTAIELGHFDDFLSDLKKIGPDSMLQRIANLLVEKG